MKLHDLLRGSIREDPLAFAHMHSLKHTCSSKCLTPSGCNVYRGTPNAVSTGSTMCDVKPTQGSNNKAEMYKLDVETGHLLEDLATVEAVFHRAKHLSVIDLLSKPTEK